MRAVEWAREHPGAATEPFLYLDGAEYPSSPSVQTRHGATYRSLAYIGHRLGMSKAERDEWITLAAQAGLSQAHAGHIIAALNLQDEAVERVVAEVER